MTREIRLEEARKAGSEFAWLRGDELRVGDTIKVWWSGPDDTCLATIRGLTPYDGPHKRERIWRGAQKASLTTIRTGMMIFADDNFEVGVK